MKIKKYLVYINCREEKYKQMADNGHGVHDRNKNGGKAHTLSRTRNIDKKKHSCIAI